MSSAQPTFWWHYRRSLASRVTLLTTIAVGVSIAAIALGAYLVIRHQLQANTDASLLRRAHAVATDHNLGDNQTIPSWALGAADARVAVIEPSHVYNIRDFGSSFPSLGRTEFNVADGKALYSVRTISTSTADYRVAAVPLPDHQGGAVVLAESMVPEQQMFKRLAIVMICFGVAGAIIAGFLGWGVASGGLRPVRHLTDAVEQNTREEDLTPLPIEGTDEIARLATAFNGMLAALEASQQRQRQLVADASHELRTPLTSLRTNIDLLTQAGDSLTGTQRAELMDDLRGQTEEMTTLIGDLVELARDEPALPVVEMVDVPDVLDHALARVRRRAPGLQWQVDTESWWVLGEASGIERAITNLLDNAAKWSPADACVRVALVDGTLTVDDEGPGIDEADLPHVFDRFYRSMESRAMPGSGLGLAIVRQVAERLGGSVEASRSPYGGARLVLHLPGTSAPTEPALPSGVS
jgi:two-component system, OmpR family, sensor histidine kinase MprB